MAVAQISTASLDKLFLEYILPGINIEIEQNTTLYNRFQTVDTVAGGKYAVIKCLTATPKSARPSSNSTFPTADQETYNEFLIYTKRSMYASLQFENLAIACAKGKGAIKDLVQSAVDSVKIQIANKFNRQFWGDGSGRLAIIQSNVPNSDTVLVDGDSTNWGLFGVDTNEYTNPARYLDEGMLVDIYSSAGTKEADSVEISTIVDGGAGSATLTMASAVTCTANGFIFDEDTYASSDAAGVGVPNGLRVVVDNANGKKGVTSVNFQNISRSANNWAKAQLLSNSSNPIDEDTMLKLIFKCEKFGRIGVILSNSIIYRAYKKILSADKSIVNEPAMWGGITGLTFYGGRKGSIPYIWDDDCQDQRIYFLDESTLKVFAPDKTGLEFVPGETGRILTRVQGKDEYTVNMRKYDNFGTAMPQANGVLTAVKHAAT